MSSQAERTIRSKRSPRRSQRPAVEGPLEAADLSAPRSGAKRTLTGMIRELPNYLRLLWGLMTDVRVQRTDKLLALGALAYIIMPLDFIPDFIPFLGEVDDVFLLVISLQRLVQNAGKKILADHWAGDPAALEDINMYRVVAAAAFFLPRRMRRRLRAIGRL